MRKRLTDQTLLAMKPRAQRYHIGDSVRRGLRVRVSPDGVRTFSVVFRAPTGAVRTFTIGEYPEVSLTAAREKAEEVKANARLGTDLQEEKIEAREEARAAKEALTFAKLARKALDAKKELAKSTRSEYDRMIKRFIEEKRLGKLLAPEVTRRHLKDALEEIADGNELEGIPPAPVMANRVFQLLRLVSRWGVREDYLEADPSLGLQRPRKENSRERVLSDDEVTALWKALDAAPAIVSVGVKALLLLGQRSTETIDGMRWADLDLEGATPVWAIPGKYRKGGRAHAVPLSPTLVRILKALPRTGVRVFDGICEANAERDWWGDVRMQAEVLYRGEHNAEMPRFSKHDLRRTCATGCAKLGASPWTVSRILGHALAQGTVAVSGVYNRYTGLPEMAAALTAWAAHVERLATGDQALADVVPMRGRA